MADLIGIAASAAGGGMFGILGTALGRLAGYYERKQTMAHEARKWQHEVQLLELQRQAVAAETEAELALEHAAGRWDGLQASLNADADIRASYPWVDAVRGLTRPMLTFLLWGITILIWFSADPEGRSSLTETASFAATAATLWWFGDRSVALKGSK